MVATPSLGHIMQKHRHKQGPPRFNFRHHVRCHRCCLGELIRLNLMQYTDGFDRVFIDCVTVIHVELHHRHNPPKIRQKFAKNATLIHQAQNPLRVFARRQDRDKELVCLPVLARLRAHGWKGAGDPF